MAMDRSDLLSSSYPIGEAGWETLRIRLVNCSVHGYGGAMSQVGCGPWTRWCGGLLDSCAGSPKMGSWGQIWPKTFQLWQFRPPQWAEESFGHNHSVPFE